MAREAKVVQLKLRMPQELHARLKFAAEMRGKSLNATICSALERSGEPTEREAAAIAILRAQALADAIKIAEAGESNWTTQSRADQLLNYTLGVR